MTAPARPQNVTGTGVVNAGPCTVRGLSLRDDSAAGNTVTLYDNLSASDTVVATVVLEADGSANISMPDGLRCDLGLYLETTGAVVGSVWIG